VVFAGEGVAGMVGFRATSCTTAEFSVFRTIGVNEADILRLGNLRASAKARNGHSGLP
jgi:hypothetical protein